MYRVMTRSDFHSCKQYIPNCFRKHQICRFTIISVGQDYKLHCMPRGRSHTTELTDGFPNDYATFNVIRSSDHYPMPKK